MASGKLKWLRLDAQREFVQYATGRIERVPDAYGMGGFIYFTRATPNDGRHRYSGTDFASAQAALPTQEDRAPAYDINKSSQILEDAEAMAAIGLLKARGFTVQQIMALVATPDVPLVVWDQVIR